MNVVLISTYELGHQPFGLASPAAWLKQEGANVACLDLAVQPFDADLVEEAQLIAFYLPMHTATRLAAEVIRSAHAVNPHAYLCAYGLYAPLNESFLRSLGVQALLGGEFEQGLIDLYKRLAATKHKEDEAQKGSCAALPATHISLDRQQFLRPDRSTLLPLSTYAYVELGDGNRRVTGYTEASRGCKHTCRHCPVVPIYNGRFRVVQREVVLADIRQQVTAGAQHITFGDPDFFNGPGHAIPIVQALHAEFPTLSYDVTIKVEHLLKHADLLPVLRDTGCLFITSAVEAVDDTVLSLFDKRHTKADFIQSAVLLREKGLVLNPTFVTFTPWTTIRSYLDLLETIAELGLIENVAPIQYAIRLLIPKGSRLLQLPEVQALVAPFDEAALCYPWSHPDPAMDQLYRDVLHTVHRKAARHVIFERVVGLAEAMAAERGVNQVRFYPKSYRAPLLPLPHQSEPWYC